MKINYTFNKNINYIHVLNELCHTYNSIFKELNIFNTTCIFETQNTN
jgi:hypothetical protein